jgi:uncharacterized coiled-coil protein SlyX
MSQAEIKTVVTRVNVVRQRRIRVAMLIAALLVISVTYYGGYQSGFDDRVPLVLDEAGLKARISKLETRLSVDAETVTRLRTELASKESKVGELERELVFYRDIMSSSEDVSSVKVRQPDMSWKFDSRELEYRAVVQRLAPGTQSYKGELRVELIDAQGRVLDASYSTTPTYSIGFKYFQRISGIITVPESFIPAELRFAITLTKPRKRTHEQVFAWQEPRAESSGEVTLSDSVGNR